jgi:hypothetical protein
VSERDLLSSDFGIEPLEYDAWTPLDYKLATRRRFARSSQVAPDWTGDHRRRLAAYGILRAYIANAARRLIEGDTTEAAERRTQHREYGDASVIVNSLRSALLGDDQTVVVDGAEDFDPDVPTGDADAQTAFTMQEWLREWADRERLPLKLIETEGNAVGLGDGVYTLGWSSTKRRVRLRVWDPSFYFPVLEDGMSEDDYPTRVHIAWEMPPVEGDRKKRIRRITWQMGPIGLGREAGPEGLPLLDGEDVEVGPDGPRITRAYPWNDEPSAVTCYLSDAVWTLDTGRPLTVDDLSEANATWETDIDGEVRMRDLGIDFIPVVHVPNTVSLLDHYGRSSLSTVMQLLDDIAAADTDLQAASATTGTPVVSIAGARSQDPNITWRPGQLFELADGGRMDVMDTSRGLDALLKYIEALQERLSVNAKLPQALLGRVEPQEVASGVALRLQFGPLERMVNEMRLVRDEKYPLLLKFVWRMSKAARAEDVPETFIDARIEFGAYLPADESATVTQVVALLQAKAISRQTAVQMLMEAGMSIADVAEEVARIAETDFEGAIQFLEATGDEARTNEYLGLEEPVVLPEEPPAVTLPPRPPPEPRVT